MVWLTESESFLEKHKVIQTAYSLVQRIRKVFVDSNNCLDINEYFLVDMFGELLEENTL